MFKVGDKVRCKDKTLSATRDKVGLDTGRILQGSVMAALIGKSDYLIVSNIYDDKGKFGAESWMWHVDDFELAGPCCSLCGQVLPVPPIVINGNTVEFCEDRIKVGCTTVTKDTVKIIAERMGLLPAAIEIKAGSKLRALVNNPFCANISKGEVVIVESVDSDGRPVLRNQKGTWLTNKTWQEVFEVVG